MDYYGREMQANRYLLPSYRSCGCTHMPPVTISSLVSRSLPRMGFDGPTAIRLPCTSMESSGRLKEEATHWSQPSNPVADEPRSCSSSGRILSPCSFLVLLILIIIVIPQSVWEVEWAEVHGLSGDGEPRFHHSQSYSPALRKQHGLVAILFLAQLPLFHPYH